MMQDDRFEERTFKRAQALAVVGSWPFQRRNLPSIFASVCLHLLLLLGMVWLLQARRPEPSGLTDRAGKIVLASAKADQETQFLERLDTLERPLQPANDALSAAANAAPELAQVDLPPAAVAQPGIGPLLESLDANRMSQVSAGAKKAEQTLTEAQLALIEADRAFVKSQRPAGPATTIRVFGSGKLTGRKFLFLIDRSKSMGGSGLGVIQAARTELAAAVGALDAHHRFQVVGYNQNTVPIKARQMLPATTENQQQVSPFLSRLAAFGATDHYKAITAATTYQTDIIVVLTDGGPPGLNEAQLRQIKQLASGIQIHCLQFGFGKQQTPQNFLMELASQNAGSYRYIDVLNWQNDNH